MKVQKKVVVAALVAAAVVPFVASAGTGGTEFDGAWTTIQGWLTGTLGKIIAGAFVLIGIVAGIARQSLMALAIGIAGGLGLNNAPSIIDSVLTATLPVIGG